MASYVLLFVCVVAAVCVSGASCLPFKEEFTEEAKRLEADLRKLGCEPKPVLVNIMEELGPLDPLADKNFYPQVLSVNRCFKKCSFCGIPRYGMFNEKECLPQPQGVVNRPVTVSFLEGNEEDKVIHVDEHTACECRYEHTW